MGADRASFSNGPSLNWAPKGPPVPSAPGLSRFRSKIRGLCRSTAAAMLAEHPRAAYLSGERRGRALVLNSASEPMFNVPPVVAATVAVLASIQAIREFILPESADLAVLAWFAFIPARYDPTPLVHGAYPGGIAADVWTFATYALLHGNWLHLGLNAIWLLAFGTPVARRFGRERERA